MIVSTYKGGNLAPERPFHCVSTDHSERWVLLNTVNANSRACTDYSE